MNLDVHPTKPTEGYYKLGNMLDPEKTILTGLAKSVNENSEIPTFKILRKKKGWMKQLKKKGTASYNQ